MRSLPPLRPLADKEPYNDVLEAMATFREVHFGWASEYIHQRVTDPRGTGGTPYMQWLGQLIDETRAFKLSVPSVAFRNRSHENHHRAVPDQDGRADRAAHAATSARRSSAAAGFNLFLIPAEDVLIDLLTDSGTAAMSSEQWAGMHARRRKSTPGRRAGFASKRVLQEITGMPHILPTHQGRASERILFELVGGPGKVVPSNTHFDTTRANIEHSGAEAVDLPIAEAREPRSRHPFKGNLDSASSAS